MAEPMSEEARAWRLVAIISSALVLFLCGIEGYRHLTDNRHDSGAREQEFGVQYKRLDFSTLAGWDDDNHYQAISPLLLSCDKILLRQDSEKANSKEALGFEGISFSGLVGDWRAPCAAAREVNTDPSLAKTFFEEHFVPVQIFEQGKANKSTIQYNGLFTGYFEPAYSAFSKRTDKFSVPVLTRPRDLIMVDLGAFREELAGQRIAGTVQNGNLIPFFTHEEIVESGLDVEILAWMDPNDLLFLQIQGSGKLKLENKEIRVGYAGQNGHPYTAIGRPLIQRGEIALENMSMQAIYDWLEKATDNDAKELRYVNQSYVFFRPLTDLPKPELGPLGAGGVQLTEGRSLAIDRRYYAMGTPIWLDYQEVETDQRTRRLFIAQDTGGAIRGPIRGDVYVGGGKQAGELAGKMKQQGQLVMFAPKAVAQRLEAARAQTTTH